MHIIRMKVTWDPRKAESNKRKHSVRFPDIEAVFLDPHSLIEEDISSVDEQRFVVLGKGDIGRLYVVVYAYQGDRIRVISARRARRSEARVYERGIRFQQG